MPDNTNDKLIVRLPGLPIAQPGLPRALQAARRAADADVASPFLPAGLVRVAAAYEVSPTARATDAGAADAGVPREGVLALELPDGLTLFIRADKLAEDLGRIDPEALDEQGRLLLDALRARGAVSRGAFTNLVSRLFSLDIGSDAIIDEAREQALGWASKRLGEAGLEKLQELAELGVTRLGAKALMWAIEKRLPRGPGLYRWVDGAAGAGELLDVSAEELERDAKAGPLLVFIHGTASSTVGSFGKLRARDRQMQADWEAIAARYGERIYGFEHRSFSESPIENALALARALPRGARLAVVTHSRGGLVGDLLALGGLDDALIESFTRRLVDPPLLGAERMRRDLADADREDRENLLALRDALAQKALRVERYVRVACPANGTRLLSANLDVFLSGLLALLGTVTTLAASPVYQAVQRIVLEIARHRTRPELVPGIEAMLPQSPVADLLARARLAECTRLAIIAGDIEGGGLLKRLGVLLTDVALFDRQDNDLVVDTDSMYTGLARPGAAWRRFEQGPQVNHFRYFENDDSRAAMRDWLTAADTAAVTAFQPLAAFSEPGAQEEQAQFDAITRSRGAAPADPNRPVVVVLPGVMGSHLTKGSDRVWFDPVDLAFGGLKKIAWSAATGQGERGDGVEAEKLLSMAYGDLCRHLLATHRVESFPYDWRQPVQAAARRLGARLRALLDETETSRQPVRLLAHSMGGLVVRALIAQEPALFERLMDREGARFVMLGTPNQGSHSMVSVLLGKDDNIRRLARLDMATDMQDLLDMVKAFRGVLQLLPKPDFRDVGVAQAASETDKGPHFDYLKAATWTPFRDKTKDFWFGDGKVGVPDQAALDEAAALWRLPGLKDAALPVRAQDKSKIIYVFGAAPNTPCGLVEKGGRLKLVGTPKGDGTVTWASGRIEGVGSFYQMPVSHGDLLDSEDHFPAIVDLLRTGATDKLPAGEPALRGAIAETQVYDAGPVTRAPVEEVMRGLLGASPRKAARAVPAPALEVRVVAGDLRYSTLPVMVGHYEQDPIAGAEKVIDRLLLQGELTMRHHLGLYAGPVGTATIVLKTPNEQERLRGSFSGAVVVGMGRYGELSLASLTEAVRAGTLRYLLHLADSGVGRDAGADRPAEVKLACLLMGYNSTTNISIEDSVSAILRGVLEANQKFAGQMKLNLRVTQLELIELYLDTAISATRAVHKAAERINRDGGRRGMRVQARATLEQREGWRQRLEAAGGMAFWPRLIVTDPDRADEAGEAGGARTALARQLRFVYLGQRARAESVQQQRQPGLVETLVEKSIRTSAYSEDFSRTLFQLLVPHDFKEAARQMERMALVVDGYTANLPWELMLADHDKPMAVKTAMVRQFATLRYRLGVRQTLGRTAYVVGNPSSAGFARAFPDAARPDQQDPDALPGAENEANTVVRLLRQHDYAVTEAIGADQGALEIINRLYRQPYRVLHIAAHGVYDIAAADGTRRSGVVLSDGLLVTAVEIAAMEVVPDLVFLNCCHLGKVDRAPVAYNRLAYSVARELIEIGVRAVVVAGWAVDDAAANLFAETFYTRLFEGVNFGQAVFEARVAAWEKYPACNTWGAYQAYGDAGFLIEPRAMAGGGGDGFAPVSPEELLDRLIDIRARVTSSDKPLTAQQAKALDAEAQAALRQGAAFADRPKILFALGELYDNLGLAHFEAARDCYLRAIEADDDTGGAPIRAIEQLANLEARQGEATLERALVESALGRLYRLRALTRPSVPGEEEAGQAWIAPAGESENAERAALIGGAFKRKAALHAREILAAAGAPPAGAGEDLDAALEAGIAWYHCAEGKADTPGFKPYHALNRLGLRAARDFGSGQPGAQADAATAQDCARRAYEDFRADPSYWNGVIPADALLAQKLLDRSLGEEGDAGSRAFAAVRQRYAEALANLQRTERQRDSTARHIGVLGLLFRAQARRFPALAAEAQRVADRLDMLARDLKRDMPPVADAGAQAGAEAAAPPQPRRGGKQAAPGAAKESRAEKDQKALRARARKDPKRL